MGLGFTGARAGSAMESGSAAGSENCPGAGFRV